MANATAVSLPRIEKPVSTYAPGQASSILGMSHDFEDIIERLESLRFGRDYDAATRSVSVSVSVSVAVAVAVSVSGPDRAIDPESSDEHPPSPRGSDTSDTDSRDDENESLVERGPIKSQLLSTNRDQPYWTTNEYTRSLKPNEFLILDYEKTAAQIFQDKECSEKLNACLDQLQEVTKTALTCCPGNKHDAATPSDTCDFTDDLAYTPAIIANDPSEDSLLEIISRGAFQAAQSLTETDYSRTPKTPDRESLDSSPANSPGFQTWSEPVQTLAPNLTCSPQGSPRVTAGSTHRPLQLLSPLSYSSPSCSTSSSNQSYGDASSPISYQVPVDSRLGDQLGKHLENFTLWNDACTDGEISRADGIDNNELQLVEEVLRGMGGEKSEKEGPSKSENAASMFSFGNPEAGRQSVRDDLPAELYPTRFDHEIPLGNSAAVSFSRYAAHGTGTENEVLDCGMATPIEFRYARNSFPSKYPETDAPNGIVQQSGTETAEPEVASRRVSDFPFVPTLYRSSPSPSSSSPSSSSSSSSPSSNADSAARAATDSRISFFEQQYRRNSFDEFRFFESTITKDEFQIPKMVASFESCPRQRRNSDRSIMPWPSLNLPSVKASERLKEGLNPKEVKRAMSNLLKRSIEELAKQDEDGDTLLMCLVGNPDELSKKRAYLVPLVERLSALGGALSITNNRGEDALYLAALNCPRLSYVTGYLAAAMLQKGIDVSRRLYHTRGDTLIHSVAAQGDSHGEILAELLALRTVHGNVLFDLSKRNYDGRTPLHVAIESHDPLGKGVASLAIVKLLLNYGADPKIKETKCGDTALHMAVSSGCDPALVKVLLAAHATPNDTNYNHNTPLHTAASVSNSVPLDRQREVCWLLIQAGGHTNLQNRQGKTPLAVASADRKDAIRKIFYKRS